VAGLPYLYSDFEVERHAGSWQVGGPELFGSVGMPPGPNGVSGANQARAPKSQGAWGGRRR
jgi:hypothetical protein